MKCDLHFSFVYKEGLVFRTKNKKKYNFLGDSVIGTFKKLNYEWKLGLYFSPLTSLVLKYFQISSNKVNWRTNLKGVLFSKGTETTSVLSACQTFAKCADDPQVLELLQKCFVKIKTAKQTTVISHESRAKKEKKTATTIIKKKD